MKVYIAVTATLELSVSQKLIETITALAKELLEEKHVLVSLLGVSEKTELLTQFTNECNEDLVKQAFKKMSSFGKSDLSSLSLYFDLNNDKMEDGHCYVFCDRFQPLPSVLFSRLSFSFAVFSSPKSYPTYYCDPNWDTFSTPETPANLGVKEFVEECCKGLRLVTNVIISFKDKYGFSASPYPRMPQKKLFEDPEFLFPPGAAFADNHAMEFDCPTATMQFCSFLPETSLHSLQARGCTYFLKPSSENIDKTSYFALSNRLLTNHKIGLFRRYVGDYFLVRPYRQSPEATIYLMAEYILSTTIKFAKSPTDLPVQKFRKHTFSYDGHTSFANQECMEMALSRIGRMIRRETDEQIVKRELLLASRHMAASCHPQLAYAVTSILNDRLNEVTQNLQKLFKNLLKVLAEEGGLKKMVEYLEKEIPTSKTKSKLY